MFSDFGGKDIPELVALVEEHRRTAQDAERARTRVDLWLLAMHPPQRITGQVDMAVRPPSSQDGPILSGEVIAGAGTQGGDESQPLAPRPEPPDRSHTEVAIRTYPPRAWNTPATRVDGQTVRFVTEGGETGIPLPGKLRSMRFLTPHEQIVRAADLPATVPLGDGRHLTVVAFKWGEVTDTALGYAIIDEADAVGVEVMFQAFYET
ncbi:MAG: hypothetical protein HY875_12660 [Chloroflexi bacterium]|nr:hypothetical protein [Chloroflexota bacterium]